jgi:hypothetical protein
MFGALAARFDHVEREPKFEQARLKLSKYALTPSKLLNDTSVWTSVADTGRVLTLSGSLVNGRYRFAPRAQVRTPDKPGDSRHYIRLRRIGESDYDWRTDVDHHIGIVRALDVATLARTLLASAEGRSANDIRADYRLAFPRTSRALGTLLSLDTLRAVSLGDGTTALTFGIKIEPGRLRPTAPNFAKYIDKYVEPARFRLMLVDPRGGTWVDAAGDDNYIALKLRTRDGQLVSLNGPPRALPDSLILRIDAIAHFLIFDVGVSKLIADFSFVRSDHDRAWVMRFRQEPDWHFPLAVRHFIRAPLRRPFEGEGAVLRIGVRDVPGGPAMLYRHGQLAVRESAILRWLGGLGSTAMSDFAGRAEVEENRWLAQALYAMRDDAVALLGGTPGANPAPPPADTR